MVHVRAGDEDEGDHHQGVDEDEAVEREHGRQHLVLVARDLQGPGPGDAEHGEGAEVEEDGHEVQGVGALGHLPAAELDGPRGACGVVWCGVVRSGVWAGGFGGALVDWLIDRLAC